MPSEIPPDKLNLVTEALLRGKKIEAIRHYREATGLGLKESKEAVEALEPKLREQYPHRFISRPKGKGCFGAAAILCISIGVVGYWMIR